MAACLLQLLFFFLIEFHLKLLPNHLHRQVTEELPQLEVAVVVGEVPLLVEVAPLVEVVHQVVAWVVHQVEAWVVHRLVAMVVVVEQEGVRDQMVARGQEGVQGLLGG